MTDPIPYPHNFKRPEPSEKSTVRAVESKKPTPIATFTIEGHLTIIRNILERARCRGGQLHPREALKGLESLAEVEKVLDEKHTEGMKGSNHD